MSSGSYKLELSREAEGVYFRLFERDRSLFERLRAGLEAIAENPWTGKKLKARRDEAWSFRVGQYRILYRIEDRRLVVFVLDMGHRREIYR